MSGTLKTTLGDDDVLVKMNVLTEWGHLVMAVTVRVSNVFSYVLSYVFSSVSELFGGVRDLVNGVFGCVSN